MEKSDQIARIVEEALEEQRQGLVMDLQAITRRHPELMPDLGLRLAAIQARRNPVKQTSHSDAKLKFIQSELPEMDVVECVDQGAQGAIYKAVHGPTRREVAIKILLGGSSATDEERQRFTREVQLVARLRHPNIVRIYDSGEIGGCSYIVMEFIEGLRIDDYVCMAQLTVPEVITLFCQVCNAVSAAHQHGVLHRDLKPSNVLIDSEGQARVLDFGLAKDMDAPKGQSMLSVSGQIVGTLPYLSPERVRSNESSTSCDVYALGVILFELLTGSYPYPVTENNFETLSNIVYHEPQSPRKALPQHSGGAIKRTDINSDLERIILKSLAKAPSRRYASVAEFAADLHRYLRGEATLAQSDSKIYVLRKTVRKFRVLFISSTICIVILIVALIGVNSAWRRSEEVAKVAMAGLEMSSLLKLGSVERDAGRIDQAIGLFERVVQIAQVTATDDSLVLRQLCNAHHRLAGVQLEKKNIDVAAYHSKRTFDLAEKLAARDPLNLEYQSQLAFAWNLRGQVAFQRQNFDRAMTDFCEAVSIQKRLVANQPEDASLAGDLAFTLGLQGNCARRLGQREVAVESYTNAFDLFRRMHEAEPDNLNRGIDLVRAQSKMAILHLSFKTSEDNAVAARWLETAEQQLADCAKQDTTESRKHSIDELNYEISYNKNLVQRRLSASTPDS